MIDQLDAVRTRPSNLTPALTLCAAAGCWVIAVTQMRGMDMGVATTLGPFPSFLGLWIVMMAAMMLPGAVPVVRRFAQSDARGPAALTFLTAYLAVWTLFGVAAYAVYRPHSSTVAGVAALVTAAYELTPLKRQARRLCRDAVRSGWQFGSYCVGSSIGLMVVLLAAGAMSVAWMTAVTVLVLAQKLLRPRAMFDVVIAAAIAGLGLVILLAPSSIPGLVPSM